MALFQDFCCLTHLRSVIKNSEYGRSASAHHCFQCTVCFHEIFDLLNYRILADDSRLKDIFHLRCQAVNILILNIQKHSIDVRMFLNAVQIQILICQLRRNIDSRFADKYITARKSRKTCKFFSYSFCKCSSSHYTIRNICAHLYGTLHQLFLAESQTEQTVHSDKSCCRIRTATRHTTSNPRVLGADPLVEYQPAKGEKPEVPGGIGEEDIVYLVLPYIHSAREGVLRLGSLLEQYGTYEMNGIAFQDVNEIWWLETIGGHHWIARRVPDDVYVVMPNQLGIDTFDLEDAFGAQKNYLCSADLREFIAKNHLDLSLDGALNPRDAFGSHDDADHVYNTPRAWYMLRYLNPRTWVWEGADADYTPISDDLPWCMVPERKVTPEDIKYMLSSHYQGTPYDPYLSYGDRSAKGAYRSIGINRNDFMALLQMRPDQPEESRAVEWVAYASNAFNTMVPFYANVECTPEYLANTTGTVSTDNFYWTSRLIAAMADASYNKSLFHLERYEEAVLSAGRALVNQYDAKLAAEQDAASRAALREEANTAIAAMLQEKAADTLDKVLFELSSQMKNAYSRSDA